MSDTQFHDELITVADRNDHYNERPTSISGMLQARDKAVYARRQAELTIRECDYEIKRSLIDQGFLDALSINWRALKRYVR